MKWSDTAWAWFSIFLENPLVQVGRHLLALRHATSLRRAILIAICPSGGHRRAWSSTLAGPRPVGHCFQADGRRARFLVDEGSAGDALLDLLARHPKAPARPVSPYGVKGWLLEG
jgi:hypothetical protein